MQCSNCAGQCSAVQCSAVQCSAVQCTALHRKKFLYDLSLVEVEPDSVMEMERFVRSLGQGARWGCGAVQCSAVQRSAVHYSAVHYSAVHYSAVQCGAGAGSGGGARAGRPPAAEHVP